MLPFLVCCMLWFTKTEIRDMHFPQLAFTSLIDVLNDVFIVFIANFEQNLHIALVLLLLNLEKQIPAALVLQRRTENFTKAWFKFNFF